MNGNCDICHFTASDGYEFGLRHWTPATQTPRAFVVALHGIQSHSGWYEYSSSRLAEAGYDVRFLDRRGSGMNLRERGHAPHHLRLMNDVVQFLNIVRLHRDEVAPTSPVVLLGVSWGAKLAAVLAAARGELIDELALLYPGICSRVRPSWHQRLRLRLAQRLEIRDKLIRIPLDDPALFTSSPDWQRFIRDDPAALHEVTVSFLNASLDLDRLAEKSPEAIGVPVLLMLAGNDQIIDNRATRKFVAGFASQYCSIIEYPQAAHTLEFEPDRDRFVNDLLNWLSSIPRHDAISSQRAANSFHKAPHLNLSGIRSASSPQPNVI
jgi:alpha-beta hydrolase superfamily lysophospholipase